MGKRAGRAAVISAVAVVVAGGGAAAYAAVSSRAAGYRLAAVTSAQVTSSVRVLGTLTPVRQADVAFPVSGSVAFVAVKPGQHVAAGQTLGSLDKEPLRGQLAAARSSLANANLRVANDEASQNAAASGPSTHGGPSLGSLQRAVLSAQRATDAALAQARAAVTQMVKICGTSPKPGPSNSPTPVPTPSPSPTPSKCAVATQRALAAETAALGAEQALAGQLAALGKALSQAGGSASGSGGSGSGGGVPVSAAQLAADQASADADAAQVKVAEQALAAARAVSPISGVVVAVDVARGAGASAGATAFVVEDRHGYGVVADVPVSDMPDLQVGQQASVLPDGMSVPLRGTVASIGLSPVAGSSPAVYPVTIDLAGKPSGLHSGGYASVDIVTGRSAGVSVPTSAVHRSGRAATVTVYDQGSTRSVRVTVGTMGPVMTRITSGLQVGEQVVLANLGAPIPAGNVSGRRGGPSVSFHRAVLAP